MAIRFDTDEWIKEVSRQLNESKDYEASAKDWEGDFIFVVEPDESYAHRLYFFLSLFHGKSPDAAMIASEDERKADYKVLATYSTWRKVIRGSWTRFRG